MPNEELVIDGSHLTTSEVYKSAFDLDLKVTVKEETLEKIHASSKLLNDFINEKRVIYGVNTSVGGFVDWLVPNSSSRELQENLVSAVATNVGPYLDNAFSRAAMLVRLNSLARGASAISTKNFKKLLEIYNAGIIPCIPSKGSLGASGDLGPLAYIALVSIGRWKAVYKGKIVSGMEALEKAGIEPMKLGFKEGLSLVNGTSAMTGLAAILVEKAKNLIKAYDVISCLVFESLKVKKKPFNPIVHQCKPHRGQLQTAKNIWSLLENSQMIIDEAEVEEQLKSYLVDKPVPTNMPIEDAYSIRCTPHVLGPIRDNILWIQSVVVNEINSSNDNPLVISENQEVFHCGHFHGQYISMAMDNLSICLTTLSNLSDRRIDRFMDHHHSNGLPPFLSREMPGLRLGFMGGQFMSTSLTAENRSLCNPVSTQSLPSTGDFQDIVSMGLIASRRAKEIYDNSAYIISFELLCACQAAEIRGQDQLSTATKLLFEKVRKRIPYLNSDQSLTNYLEELSELLKSNTLLNEIEEVIGETKF